MLFGGNGAFCSFRLDGLSILAAGHAVGVAEETGKGGTTGYARQFADDADGVVGGLEQVSHMLQAVAIDEGADGIVV